MLTIVAAFAAGCGSHPATDTKSADALRAATKASAIAALAQRNRADDRWEDAFNASERIGIYTYELQAALMRPDAKPVVLVGSQLEQNVR